jgi:sterol desaturase/sphingolipid hydroxylase (fatty acid hydroxylase superfamily)
VLQTLIGATVVNSPLLPGLRQLCLWDPRGWAVALLLHVGFSEPVFYLAHRALHRAPLFARYHAAHHSSGVTQPLTGAGSSAPFRTPTTHCGIISAPFALAIMTNRVQ